MTAIGVLEPVMQTPATSVVEERCSERAVLVCAAERVITQGGFCALSVRAVCQEAGLSVHRFYEHFQSKDGMIAALLEKHMTIAADYLAAVVDRAGPPALRVRVYVAELIGFAFDKRLEAPTALFATHSRTMRLHHQRLFDRCLDRIVAPLVACLADGNRDGSLRSPDPVADAMAVLYLTMGLVFDQPATVTTDRRIEVEGTVGSFVERALRLSATR